MIRLSLKIGKLIYKDYSGGGEPSIREFNVDISEELTNVTNIKSLLGLVATKALAKSALNIPFDLTTDILKGASGAPKQAVDTLKNTADTLKNTAGTLKDKIKLPFGKN